MSELERRLAGCFARYEPAATRRPSRAARKAGGKRS